jgi:PKD repeat protein
MCGGTTFSAKLTVLMIAVTATALVSSSFAGHSDLKDGMKASLSAEPMCTLYGWVNDSVTHEGIGGAMVMFISTEEFWVNYTVTNDTGYYELPANRSTLLVGCNMTGYLTFIDFIDTTGMSDYRLDIELEAEPTVPKVSMTIDPDHNISAHDPLTVSMVVEDFNLMNVGVMIGSVLDRTDDWLNFTLMDLGAASVPPGIVIGDLDFDLIYEDDVLEGTCEWQATLPRAGYLVNNTSSEYLRVSATRTIDLISAGFISYYYNDTLMMEEGLAWFDTLTGHYEGFEFVNLTTLEPSPIPDAPPNDPYGEIAPLLVALPWCLDSSLTFEEMACLPPSLAVCDQRSVAGLTFEHDEIAPSGDYIVLLYAIDEASNMNGTVELFTVDTERPRAYAGEDQTIKIGDEVTLMGSGSSDNVGVDNYTWEFEDDGVDIIEYGEVVSYEFLEIRSHRVILTVRDGGHNEDSDIVYITVEADEIPVAEAGPAELTVPEDMPVTFDGGDSYDEDGEVVDYSWTIVELGELSAESEFTYTFEEPGTYHVELVVVDDAAQTSEPDLVLVTVTDETAPVADAGEDIHVLIGETFTLDGTGSSDNMRIDSYLWSCGEMETWEADVAEVEITFESEATYTFTLEISDAAGNSDTDTVTVYVTDPNEAPVADAGTDLEISVGETADLDGSGSSDDAGIENYTWTFEYDEETVTLYGETAEFTFDIEGEYTVNLTVSDEQGEKGYDQVVVTVTKGETVTGYALYAAAIIIVLVVAILAVVLIRRRKLVGSS